MSLRFLSSLFSLPSLPPTFGRPRAFERGLQALGEVISYNNSVNGGAVYIKAAGCRKVRLNASLRHTSVDLVVSVPSTPARVALTLPTAGI